MNTMRQIFLAQHAHHDPNSSASQNNQINSPANLTARSASQPRLSAAGEALSRETKQHPQPNSAKIQKKSDN
ncbi:MAG: hypothetical protein HRU31_07715 [Rhodobacteraceae bacterium]|nr:hypothetical protein [Paracoccaceae bacterium]